MTDITCPHGQMGIFLWIFLSLPPVSSWEDVWLYVGSGHLDSGLHVGTASNLSPEPSFQPVITTYNKSVLGLQWYGQPLSSQPFYC